MTQTLTDVHIDIPALSEIISVLTFQAGFNSAVVLAGTTFLGFAAGIVGTFALLRKRALVSDALSHCALPGIALMFIVLASIGVETKNHLALLSGGALSGLLGVLTIQFITKKSRLQEDTAIAVVLSGFFGFGIVLLSIVQTMNTGSEGGLHHFIYGQTAAMRQSDVVVAFVLSVVSFVGTLLLFKEFRLVCFDAEFALAQGWPVSVIDILMMCLVIVVTVVGFQSVGLLLIIALLIIPPVSARFWTQDLTVVTIISAVIGGLSGYFGAAFSSLLPRMPAGAVIVLAAGLFFLVSFLFAPQRGIIAGIVRFLDLQFKVTKDHVLRETYEILEASNKSLSMKTWIKRESLFILKNRSVLFQILFLRILSAKKLITLSERINSFALTEYGIAEALRCTRNHRLWEEYLLSYSGASASHVDYSADYVEHVLSADLVSVLEQSLKDKGKLPEDVVLPESVHHIVVSSNVDGEILA